MIEESHASQENKTVAVPAVDEADFGLPLPVSTFVRVARVQAQADRLVSSNDHSAADGVRGFSLRIVQIKLKLLCEQIAGEDRIGSGIDRKTGASSRVDWASSR